MQAPRNARRDAAAELARDIDKLCERHAHRARLLRGPKGVPALGREAGPQGGFAVRAPQHRRRSVEAARFETVRQGPKLLHVALAVLVAREGVERLLHERSVLPRALLGRSFARRGPLVGGNAAGRRPHGGFRGGVGKRSGFCRLLSGTFLQTRQNVHLPGIPQLC